MGSIDRIVRSVVAVICLGLYFSNTVAGNLGLILVAVAGVFLLTSLVSFCPLYTLLGISTCRVGKK